mgnify:CR=1 FL=1
MTQHWSLYTCNLSHTSKQYSSIHSATSSDRSEKLINHLTYNEMIHSAKFTANIFICAAVTQHTRLQTLQVTQRVLLKMNKVEIKLPKHVKSRKKPTFTIWVYISVWPPLFHTSKNSWIFIPTLRTTSCEIIKITNTLNIISMRPNARPIISLK